jgi:hypothetical protein
MRRWWLYLAALCTIASLTVGCGSKQEAGTSDSGYYYEGPVKPKDQRGGGGRAAEQAGQ